MKSRISSARRCAAQALALPAATTLLAGLLLAGLVLAAPAHAQPDNELPPASAPASGTAPGQPPIEDLAAFPRTTLEIVSGSKRHRFEVWVADTDARKEQGLMFVRDLPENEGMLFPDCCSGIWMKNTYIELDIVFVGKDGRIAKIARRARPFDETTIPAPGPVGAVVELAGGAAEMLGLTVGDRVSWAAPAAR